MEKGDGIRLKKKQVKKPDKVRAVNRIGMLEYVVKIPIQGQPMPIQLTLTEFKYLAEAYRKFAKQCGFKGF